MVSTPAEVPATRVAESRSLYTWAAAAAVIVALVGFARTYYLKLAFGTPELSALKHLHGLVMTSWLVLLVVQVRLVATGRTAVHRKVGVAGILLAALLVFVGANLAIESARQGFTPNPAIPPLAFLAIPLADMVVFVTLVTAAIALRRRSPYHKRLMVVATLALLTPAIARLAMVMGLPLIPPIFFGVTDLIIIACIAYDTVKNRRLHPAFAGALGVVVLSQVGRIVLAQTEAWMSFAKWLVA